MALTLGLVLVACSNEHGARFLLEDYLWRLSNVLDVESPGLAPIAPDHLPRARDRRLTGTEFRMDLLDFLAVQGCDVGSVVGYRNSSLGRVMPASQRLVYEVDFIRSARQCLPSLRASDALLHRELAEVVDAKQQELSLHIWNAVFAGPEFAAFMSTASGLPDPDTETQASAALQTLTALESLLEDMDGTSETLSLDGKALEQLLQRLKNSSAGGQALLRMRALSQTLDTAREMIDQTVADKRLCPMRRTTTRGTYLRNVFDRYYAIGIQPYIVEAFRTDQALFSSLDRLKSRIGVRASPTMEEWWTQSLGQGETSLFGQLRSALDAHTQSWQAALGECQLMPGATRPSSAQTGVP